MGNLELPRPSEDPEKVRAKYRIVEHAPVVTIDDVEMVLGIPKDVMVKTVLFHGGDDKYILTAVRGTDTVDTKRLARAVNIPRRQLKLVASDEVKAITGLPFGSLRPFGFDDRFTVVIDNAVIYTGTVFCSAGKPTETMIIPSQDLLALSGGKQAAIRVREPSKKREE